MSSLPEKKSLNVIVADDHPLFAKALSETIKKSDFVNKVVTAKNGLEVLNLLKNAKYDLVFLDISMPEMDGEETAFHISQDYPSIKTIAMSMYDSPSKIRQMYLVGCRSYILKIQDDKEILKAIRAVIGGERYFNQVVSEKLALNSDEEKNLQLQKEFKLSPLDLRIIVLVCKGKKNKEIGEALKKSFRTIEKYRENIYDKTGTSNATELHSFAMKNHLVKD